MGFTQITHDELKARLYGEDLLADLNRAEDEFFQRMQAEIYQCMYPALPKPHGYPFHVSTHAVPRWRQRLSRVLYRARVRLASWIVGWDIERSEGEGY